MYESLLVVSMLHNNTSTVPNPNLNCVLYLISKYDVVHFSGRPHITLLNWQIHW